VSYREVNLILLKKDKNRIIKDSSLLGRYIALTSKWNWHFGEQQCLHLHSQLIWENSHSSSPPDPEDISNMFIWNVSNLSFTLVSRTLNRISHLGYVLAKEMHFCPRQHHEMKNGNNNSVEQSQHNLTAFCIFFCVLYHVIHNHKCRQMNRCHCKWFAVQCFVSWRSWIQILVKRPKILRFCKLYPQFLQANILGRDWSVPQAFQITRYL